MIYLILAIICSSSIALIFKYSESKNLDRYQVTTSNYLIAFVISFVMSIKSGLFKISFTKSLNENISQIFDVLISNKEILSNEASFIWSITIGILTGILFFLSFIYYQKSVKENGIGLSGTFGKLGILIPMIFSIIVWNELPTKIQWIGIILSILSIVLVNISFKKDNLKDVRLSLILLFIFGGSGEFANKIFQKYALLEYKSLFLFFVFFTAFLISLYITIRKKNKITYFNFFIGLLVGLPNLFSSYFLILALNSMKTSIVFPVYSAGSIVIITLFGVLFLREKLSRKDLFSIILTIVALILMNID